MASPGIHLGIAYSQAIGDGSLRRTTGARFRSSDQSLLLGLDYRLSEYVAVELSYVELAVYRLFGEVSGLSFHGRGYRLALIGQYPFNEHIGVFARGGGGQWRAQARPGSDRGRRSLNDRNWTGGFGIRFFPHAPFNLDAGYDRYGVGDLDIHSYGLTLRWRLWGYS